MNRKQQIGHGGPTSLLIQKALSQGRQCREQGRLQQAAEILGSATQAPGFAKQAAAPDVINELCFTLLSAGHAEAAADVALRAVAELPKTPVGYFQLAQVRLAQLRPAEALQAAREGLARHPEDLFLLRITGHSLLHLERFSEAADVLSRCASKRPGDIELTAELADAFRRQGNLEAALGHMEAGLQRAPAHPRLLAGKVETLESMRRVEEAAAALDVAIARSLPHVEVATAFARLARRLARQRDAIAYIDRVLNGGSLPPAARANLLLNRGNLLEDLMRWDEAFACYQEGNALFHQPAKAEQLVADARRIVEVCAPVRLAAWPSSRPVPPRPVFIVGMPRSGTSLVEQILASHPDVAAGGERPDIPELIRSLPSSLGAGAAGYPDVLRGVATSESASASLTGMFDTYRHTISGLAGDRAVFVDKNPLNYFNVGLLAALLPDAKFIHTVRDPMDTCLSCYSSRLGPGHFYVHDLASLAGAYRAYRILMDHWRSIFPDRMLDLHYEALVRDPEVLVRRLLDFLSLPFIEGCLSFHRNPRLVRTASQDQVNRPLYDTSIGRWKRFDKQLASLRAAISDLIDVESDGPHA